MSIYNATDTPSKIGVPKQSEIPVYGATRLGVYVASGLAGDDQITGNYRYELTDHLGNVRAVIGKTSTGTPFVVARTDYYPFGMAMPGRNVEGSYRYKYQGQEKDPETGMEAFELRLWDSRIGRWLTTDPAQVGHSPYEGMLNNPISEIDPDGACPCSVCPENCSEGTIDPITDSSSAFPGTTGMQELSEIFIGTREQWYNNYVKPEWDFVNEVIKVDFINSIHDGQREVADIMSLMIPTPLVGIGAAKGATNIIKRLNRNRIKGKRFEKVVAASEGLSEYAQKRIESPTGTASYRVADFLTKTALHEVKNVKTLRLTNQLKDFILYSQATKRHMTIHVKKATKISPQIKRLEKHGIITIKRH